MSSARLVETKVIDRLEALLCPPVDMVEKQKLGQYKYIPLILNAFIEQVELAARLMRCLTTTKPIKFIDVGCGIGTKVLAASYVLQSWAQPLDGSVEVYGIEYSPEYVAVARSMMSESIDELGHHRSTAQANANCIIQGDALLYDYSPYNLVYFYCPLDDRKKQIELEERIVSTVQKGAFILANLTKGPHFNPPMKAKCGAKVREVARNIWIRL